ncbi:MAG: glycosyltransferase family 2 protein, partial [Nitrospinaceae bacterium]
PTSGFQALKGEAIRFAAGDHYPPDYPDADFLILLHRNGFRMREVTVKMSPSPDNKSMHHGPRTIYYIFKMFLSIFVTLLRQKSRVS